MQLPLQQSPPELQVALLARQGKQTLTEMAEHPVPTQKPDVI